ncbi:sensor histidine kinase [Nocardiopsis alba]|uniref:sensor histidine kinase n=1 Tax=Nocardiopsis alba TaxID=53437 RepID=UPI0035D52D8E
MDSAVRRRSALSVRVGPVGAFALLLSLVTLLAVPVFLAQGESRVDLLFRLGTAVLWYAAPVGVLVAQADMAARAATGPVLLLLAVQLPLTVVPVLMGGWTWHAVLALAVASTLVAARTVTGVFRALLLLFAGVVLTLLPMSLLFAYPVGPRWFLYWLSSHMVVVGATLLLFRAPRWDAAGKGAPSAVTAPEVESVRGVDGRLPVDLHDLLGGTLTAITLKGEVIRRMGPDHPDLAEEARGLADLARDARAEVRAAAASSWSWGLRAEVERVRSVLADAGVELSVGIERYGLPEEVDRGFALIVREAVTNALVHGQATEVEISLARVEGWIVLSVADDGVPVTGEIVPGTGLRSVEERCARLGGEMRAEADQGGRFTLTCRVPE